MTPTYSSVGQYMSPYMDSVVSSAMANMQEQNAQQQQGVVGDAITKGALGGNRVGVAQGELARQQKLADNQTIAGLYNQNYSQALGAAQADKNASLQAGQGYAGLGQTQMQTNLAQAASQLGAGTQQQQFDYQQYLNAQAFPYQQQSWLSSIVGGLGSTAGGTTKETTPSGNSFSQMLGTGLQVASLFSDKRLKEGERPVGKTFDGQTIYSYRYKGDPATHMGLMAQDVSKDHPDAVGKRGGFLTVDYDKATQDAADKGRFAHGGVVGFAMGGVPYSNDNGQWPSYGALMGGSPYANDNGDFGSYIPKVAMAGGGGGQFPEIHHQQQQQGDALSSASAQKGANVLKSYMPVQDTINPRTGMTAIFADGGVVGGNGRRGYANGGRPTADEIAAMYEGILNPGTDGGIVGSPAIPPPVRSPSRGLGDTIDTVNTINGNNLGLDVNTTLPPRGEDPTYLGVGGGDSPYAPLPERPVRPIAGGNKPGEVIYGQGDQFVTKPRDDGYSKNGFEALQSLFGGKGLNLAPDANYGLAQAGAAMASSKSPFFLAGVGEGTTAGMNAWKDYQSMERDNATARAQIGQTGEGLARQAEEAAANIAQTGATTQSIDTATNAGRFKFDSKPGGLMVVDTLNPGPPIFYPWGGTLPDGTTVDPRLMSAETSGIAVDETNRALEAAAPVANAAQSSNMMLAEVEHNLSTLPSSGLLTPGTDFSTRLEWAKGINTAFRAVGAQPPLPEKEVAAGEDLGKLTTRMGFELSNTLGSDNAASIVMSSIGAVPNGALSPQGNAQIINALRMGNQRKIDYYNFLQGYSADHYGSLLGAEAAFNRKNPPEAYAYAAVVPQEAVAILMDDPSPEGIAEFNAAFGHGTDVSKFYLKR